MGDEPESPLNDTNYNLVTGLQKSLENAWTMESHIQEAERQGDGELAEWFRKVRENSKAVGDQGQRLAAPAPAVRRMKRPSPHRTVKRAGAACLHPC